MLRDRPSNAGSRGWFGQLFLFEVEGGKQLHQIDLVDESPEQLAFSPDGKRIAAGGMWSVLVWDVASGKQVLRREGHRGRVHALAFSPDGTRLATASADSTALIWDVPR